MWTEFWNERLDDEYTLGGVGPFTGWPGHKLELDEATGRVETAEVPDMLVVGPGDPTLRLRGEIVRTVPYGAALLRPDKPLQAEWRTEGVTFDGAPNQPSRRLTLTIFRESRKVAVTLLADGAPPESGPIRFDWSIQDASGRRRGTLAAGAERRIVVEGVPAGADRSSATIELPALKLPEGNEATIRVFRIDPA
jgi:hypothetical protein